MYMFVRDDGHVTQLSDDHHAANHYAAQARSLGQSGWLCGSTRKPDLSGRPLYRLVRFTTTGEPSCALGDACALATALAGGAILYAPYSQV